MEGSEIQQELRDARRNFTLGPIVKYLGQRHADGNDSIEPPA